MRPLDAYTTHAPSVERRGRTLPENSAVVVTTGLGIATGAIGVTGVLVTRPLDVPGGGTGVPVTKLVPGGIGWTGVLVTRPLETPVGWTGVLVMRPLPVAVG